MSLWLLVEFPEEGILLDLLEEGPRPELGGEPSREGRLADADGALDRDVPPRGPVRRHPHPEREIAGPTRRVYGGEPTYGQPPTPLGIIPQSARDHTLSEQGTERQPRTTLVCRILPAPKNTTHQSPSRVFGVSLQYNIT